jgi:hypothetical protein
MDRLVLATIRDSSESLDTEPIGVSASQTQRTHGPEAKSEVKRSRCIKPELTHDFAQRPGEIAFTSD